MTNTQTNMHDPDLLNRLEDLITISKRLGATAADTLLSKASSTSVARRMGKQESLERSEDTEVGLRVFVGQRQAMVSSSDLSREALTEMAERAVAMARVVPEDPYAGIADAADLAKNFADLDLYDGTTLSAEQMNEWADRTEQAGLDVKGITNSEGASFSAGTDMTYFVASNGFAASYASSGFSLSLSVIAGEGTAMETDYAFDSAVYLSDLDSPESIGREAGERTVKSLNPRKGKTKQVPIIFDRRLSGGVIGSLASAISGSAVARGTTMLKDKMGETLFAPNITIVEDPFIKRGARSYPFDAEGIAPQKRNIIDKGVLTGWLLDLASAKKLGLKSTGNAARGVSSAPSPRASNFYMQPGTLSVDDLIKDIDDGFYVTRLLGSGGSIVTGDYSRGAAGFWIEKGKITYPVSEVTIAGNLKDMWRNIIPANDLRLKYSMDAPTVCVGTMTVAGD